ncbi:probable mitochondrial glutathione transporter SLC25A40 [Culicoides brevitarsis]|uniref:probable mitochondrial glutathione transporter SLC25A40 n=1 Tax=Culicoides brevitarsis TaxID=469753 RepID=UPI00307BE4F9
MSLPHFDRDDPRFRITPLQQCVSSCTGAMITSLLMTPFDVVKTRLQVQQKVLASNKCFVFCNGLMDHLCPCYPNGEKPRLHFTGTMDAFVKISHYEGVRSLWSGLSPTLVLALPTTVLYFVAYEQFRLRFKKFDIEKLGGNRDQLSFWVPLASGSAARVLSVTCVSPLELIRTKMQSQKLSFMEVGTALRQMVRETGVIGLWKGLFPTILRDVPFSAIYWTSYETCKRTCNVTDPTFGFSFVSGAFSGCIAAMLTVPFDVVKTHQQIEFGEKVLYTDKPGKSPGVFETLSKIFRNSGVKGLFAGIVPRLIKVAPACAIMISSFEFGKTFFYQHNVKKHYQKSTSDPLGY